MFSMQRIPRRQSLNPIHPPPPTPARQPKKSNLRCSSFVFGLKRTLAVYWLDLLSNQNNHESTLLCLIQPCLLHNELPYHSMPIFFSCLQNLCKRAPTQRNFISDTVSTCKLLISRRTYLDLPCCSCFSSKSRFNADRKGYSTSLKIGPESFLKIYVNKK